MILARNFYVPIMCLGGIVIGAFARTNPGFATGGIPPYAWLLGLSLVFDIVSMAIASRVPIVPLTMNTRVAGFFSGVALYMLIIYAFPIGGGVAA